MKYVIPSEVKIGYQTYKVVEVPCVNKFEPRAGEIDYMNGIIRIDADMADDRKFETLWHEIIHGIDEFMAVDLTEEQVRRLGRGLAVVLTDNPQLTNGGE